MNPQKKGVRTTHPDYDRLSEFWKRSSDVVDGQSALHKAGEVYLPRLRDETDADYRARISRSDFFNATWRTINGLAGMAFRKPPIAKVPAGIEPFLADIGLAGCSLDDMAKHMVEDALEYGVFGLLVDHPPAPENVTALTVAAKEALGLRPLIQYYEIESVINWRYVRVNNQTVLGLVVLKEEAPVNEDEFDHKTEPRYRVLDLDAAGQYRQRVFRINQKGEDEQVGADIYPLMNGAAMTAIPFRIVGEMDIPPLIDLVDANIAHYQINSDYRHGLHFTALPTLFVAGVQLDQGQSFHIGSTAAVVAPDPQAKAQFIEFTGQGMGAIEKALLGLEQRMAILGARMVADETRQAETLGATKIKRAGENSVLADIVIGVSDAIEWALDIFARWAGQAGEVSYQINREFTPAMMDAQTLTALVGAVQAGKLSDREFFDLMQRGDVIDAAKDFEEHQAEVDMAPAMPRPVVAVEGVAA